MPKNWFSNMLPLDRPFVYQGITFRTVEHFYQAMKLPKDDFEGRRVIAVLDSPYAAKRRCRTRDLKAQGRLRDDWADVKLEVMEFALRKKFAPGTRWLRKLLETEGEIVEQTTWCDRFWGRCSCDRCRGAGRNELGKLLMRLRDEMRAQMVRRSREVA